MRQSIIAIGIGVLFSFICPIAMGADKTFESSGQILSGETWDTIYVQNDNTVVDMLGGEIGSLDAKDASVFNMKGGRITGININTSGSSIFNISDGTVDIWGDLVLYGLGGNISGGDISANILKTDLDGVTQITGGVLNLNIFDVSSELIINGGALNSSSFYIGYEAVANIYRGKIIANNAWFGDYSTVNIYCNDYIYNPSKQLLTGHLLDNNYFSMGGVSEQEFSHLNLIPEPASVILIGFGGLLLKKRS